MVKTKRFLAALLALLMLFTLLPTLALAEGDGDEAEIILDDPEGEDPAEPELAGESETADEPEEIDLDDDELPIMVSSYGIWVGSTEITAENEDDVLGDGKVSFDASTNTLTFTASPAISGLHEGAMIYAEDDDLTIVAPAKGLTLSSSDAAEAIHVENGALTINGSLTVDFWYSEIAEIDIFAANGLTVNGNLNVDSYAEYYNESFGIKTLSGPVTINGNAVISVGHTGIYCGSGDVTITGTAYFMAFSEATEIINPASCIYTDNGGVYLKDFGFDFGVSSYMIYAHGPIVVDGNVNVVNEDSTGGGRGFMSTSGGISVGGDVKISLGKNTLGLNSGDAPEGITVKGDANVSGAVTAAGGPINVGGSLTVTGHGTYAVSAGGDIIIGKDADVTGTKITVSSTTYTTDIMCSSGGSIRIGGSLKGSTTNNGVFAHNNIEIGKDATISTSLLDVRDYLLKADTGDVIVSGKLTTSGVAKNVVSGYSITIGEVAVNEVFRDGMDPDGCYVLNAQGGSVTVDGPAAITANPAYGYSGSVSSAQYGVSANDRIYINAKWDVTAGTAAIQAKEGIEIASGYGVTEPTGGKVVKIGDYYTVTESDGAAVAAHAVIDEKATVKISFNAGEGCENPDPMEVTAGEPIGTLPIPTREGWKLIGWFLAPVEEGQLPGQGTEVTAESSFEEDTTVYAHWRMPGDVNGDEKVDNKDVLRLLRYIKNTNIEIVEGSADINGDNTVSNKDVLRLLRYIKDKTIEIN